MTSHLEETFYRHLLELNLPTPEREFRFDFYRKWRFDFAWPEIKLAVEIDGGLYQMGRHQRPAGFRNDIEKLNAATLAGWRVLRGDAKMVNSGELVSLAKRLLNRKDVKIADI